MKFRLFLLLLIINTSVFCQELGIDLPSKFGFFIYNVPDKHRILNVLKDIEEYSPNDLNIKSKWTYHLTVSSCKLYLGRDSSLYHFNEAYNIYPKGTCGSMRARHDAFIKALEEEKSSGIEDGYLKQIRKETGNSIFSWYLWDLPDFDEFAFIDSCNQLFPPKEIVSKTNDTTLYSEIIRRRDQKYRKVGDMEKQVVLDLENRNFIDSLYLLKGSLDVFDEEEIYQFSMVAHHSEDCDWVYKWTERFIAHVSNGYKGKIFLGPMLDRMFAKDGYCTEQDPQKKDYFIFMIKSKYPEFVKSYPLE